LTRFVGGDVLSFGESLHRNLMQLTGAKPAHREKETGRINDRLYLGFYSPIWWDCVVSLGFNDNSAKSGAKTPHGGNQWLHPASSNRRFWVENPVKTVDPVQ
jgi:hypothetical protein